MIWKIEVTSKLKPSASLKKNIRELNIKKSFTLAVKKVFFIEGDISFEQVSRLAQKLLADPLTEKYEIYPSILKKKLSPQEILIVYNPGVTDEVAFSLKKAAKELGFNVSYARSGIYYRFSGLGPKDVEIIARRLLYNPLIQHRLDYTEAGKIKSLNEFFNLRYEFKLKEIGILRSEDKELENISRQGNLSLSLEEMRMIKQYYQKKRRNPTDCELETIAQTWSEHCAHKTFRGLIRYEEISPQGKRTRRVINSIFAQTIKKATGQIAHPLCVSVFDDNSGIVRFDTKDNVCFKVETHNHPSSLEPYGGAATGIGGVIRDILGTGCGAKPVASTDVFCFAPPSISYQGLPEGILHPRRVMRGVVSGVRDYGNKMGIPTVNGAVLFDSRYLGNPLVYCGNVGILPKNKSFKKIKPGDVIIVAGAKTGRDGIHGATFSSVELTEDTVNLTSAVQIGNPIEEKKLAEALLTARDRGLFNAITDCGAGGLSSAVGEITKEFGCLVRLDKVPLKYQGLSYTEIWISESQERMVLVTSRDKIKELESIFSQEDVNFAVIGEVSSNKKLTLYYKDKKVCELDNNFLYNIPRLEKNAVYSIKAQKPFSLREKKSYNQDLLKLLASYNICSKEWVIRQYDHEVQGGSVEKPLGGINYGPADAAVVRPKLKSKKAIVIGCGINPFYSQIDPYWMAVSCIDEALRNVASAGADIKKTFILDNFSWASPEDENILGELVRACYGCYDAAVGFGVPFISGKDSFYNEYKVGKKRITVPSTLLISALAVIDDYNKVITPAFKQAGSYVYAVGITKNELGASEYSRQKGLKGGVVPRVDIPQAKKIYRALNLAITKQIVLSCHDLSEGGLAVASAEMCVGSRFGVQLDIGKIPCAGKLNAAEKLFSESNSRFLVEIDKKETEKFQKIFSKLPIAHIGKTTRKGKLIILDEKKKVIDLDKEALAKSWRKPFLNF